MSPGIKKSMPPLVDIIIPVFNEEEGLPIFHRQLRESVDVLPYRFRIHYVDDGSTDGTQTVLREIAREDERVVVSQLSRNFGHQAALTAGLDQAEGDYVISMDGDGQHPPNLIPEMLDLARNGYDVVLTQRVEEGRRSPFKQFSSSLFYRLINRIGDTDIIPGGADFRLLSRPVVQALRQMREYHRFLRGMVAWAGYRRVILPFKPPKRLAGRSKYSLRKMTSLSLDAIFSFSLMPLFISLSLGIAFIALAVFQVIYVLTFWFGGKADLLAPGWSSLMFVLLLMGGILMIGLGFIGIYIGYIFQEVKGRPIYFIRSAWGHDNIPNDPGTDHEAS